ncbi:MAG: phosphate acyltransferase [Chloroflexota bacterium]
MSRASPCSSIPRCRRTTTVQASETVGMDEAAANAVRRKRDASINACMRLVREGKADVVVTAGHTGAGVASATLHLGRLPGVDRPAPAIQMVTDRGPFVLLDIGATTDLTGRNLAQYARMGALYAERVLGVNDPSVALLSIGEEKGKGDTRVQRPRRSSTGWTCSSATWRGATWPAIRRTSSCATHRRQRRDEVLRGPLERDVRDAAPGPGDAPGPIGYFFMRLGLNRIRRRFDYERLAVRRCWA